MAPATRPDAGGIFGRKEVYRFTEDLSCVGMTRIGSSIVNAIDLGLALVEIRSFYRNPRCLYRSPQPLAP